MCVCVCEREREGEGAETLCMSVMYGVFCYCSVIL